MTRISLFAVAAALALAPTPTPAAPVPRQKPRPVITAGNAGKLKPVQEVEKAVYRIVPGPAKGELAFVAFEKPVEIVSDADLRELRKVADGKKPLLFAASPDGKRVAWSENNSRVAVRELPDGKPLVIETKSPQPMVAFSTDGKLLATGGYGSGAKLWNLKGELVRTLDCGGKGGLWPVFSPDGKTMAVGNRNHETRLFEVATGKLLYILPKKMSQELAFSPDGKTLAVGYVDGTVALWGVASGNLLRESGASVEEVYTVAWSPKGDVLATAGLAGKIVLWDPAKLKPLKELDGPAWVISMRFTADGTRLLTSGGSEPTGRLDRKVIVWAVPDADER